MKYFLTIISLVSIGLFQPSRCHLADFEPVYSDRMKHVIAEDQPYFAGGFHQQFAEHLAYDQRDIGEEGMTRRF